MSEKQQIIALYKKKKKKKICHLIKLYATFRIHFNNIDQITFF